MESFLTHAGYAAIILFGFLEAACIPISSEVTFGFAGVLAYQGHLNLALVIITGTLAELAGSYFSYFVGRLEAGRSLTGSAVTSWSHVRTSTAPRSSSPAGARGWCPSAGRCRSFVPSPRSSPG